MNQMQIINRYGHWLLLAVAGSGFLVGIFSYTLSMGDILASFFSIMGMAGIIYLCISVERQKRKKQNEDK
jgi:hypothetical protein